MNYKEECLKINPNLLSREFTLVEGTDKRSGWIVYTEGDDLIYQVRQFTQSHQEEDAWKEQYESFQQLFDWKNKGIRLVGSAELISDLQRGQDELRDYLASCREESRDTHIGLYPEVSTEESIKLWEQTGMIPTQPDQTSPWIEVSSGILPNNHEEVLIKTDGGYHKVVRFSNRDTTYGRDFDEAWFFKSGSEQYSKKSVVKWMKIPK